MKIREGFVSNSSSSSFIIKKKDLSYEQMDNIRNHIEVGKRLGIEYADPEDAWTIHETDSEISGCTIIDNFRIEELFRAIGVKDENITWGEY